MKRFFLLAFFPLVIASQSTLEKVESLDLKTIQDGGKTFYSNGFEADSKRIESILSNAASYFENEFGLSKTFSLTVLDSKDWLKITQIPYGLPFVSGPPYIVCIPADTENELGLIVKNSLSKSNLSEKYSLSNDEIAKLFITLIGFHELGHIYAREYGINFPNKWTFEFAATYFAYLYLTIMNRIRINYGWMLQIFCWMTFHRTILHSKILKNFTFVLVSKIMLGTRLCS
ncbi:MAG: hypothetical protein U5K00_06830 [Melioribacteraceae bacterium]|nr:hypothetical protein [Melioribacteraceae bacterium]